MRAGEAKQLLDAGFFDGARYLIGYAVECALKACIAKQIKAHDFPDKNLITNAYTHDLDKLVSIAGLGQEMAKSRKKNAGFDRNWAIAKDWSEAFRYNLNTKQKEADVTFDIIF